MKIDSKNKKDKNRDLGIGIVQTYARFFLLDNAASSDIGEVLDDLLGVLGLTGTRLTTLDTYYNNIYRHLIHSNTYKRSSIRDQHRLVLTIAQHVRVGVVSH